MVLVLHEWPSRKMKLFGVIGDVHLEIQLSVIPDVHIGVWSSFVPPQMPVHAIDMLYTCRIKNASATYYIKIIEVDSST